MARRTAPLINALELQPRNSTYSESTLVDDDEKPKQPWHHRLPLIGTVGFILAPQPSILWMLVDHHWRVLKKPHLLFIHITVIYTLTFLILSSLIICVARDPGPVTPEGKQAEDYGTEAEDDNIGLTEALMDAESDDIFKPGRWCRKCWAAKPERAHHCSICGRCVLKMDHHCPWLGSNCVGHRTYPAFVHFLTCITILAIYIAAISIDALVYSFRNPYDVSESTPVHELVLSAYGLVFSIVIGPFAAYHYYLISTNQTTLENISPFMLLRHLPPLPGSGHSLSDPPLEPELSYPQRRLVKDAHGQIFVYDVGWRKNWSQVFGWETKYGWLSRLLYGGASPGNGRHYEHNPRAEGMLSKLAEELVKLDRERTY